MIAINQLVRPAAKLIEAQQPTGDNDRFKQVNDVFFVSFYLKFLWFGVLENTLSTQF